MLRFSGVIKFRYVCLPARVLFFLVDFWDVAIRPLKCIYYICMYALVCPA